MTALSLADRVYARSPAFRRRVDRALATIEAHVEAGHTIGVSYSGGKDSTVLLDLVRRVAPDAPAAFYDSGCELRTTYEMIEHYGVEVIEPEATLEEMCRAGGYWGYRGEDADLELEFDFMYWLVTEPATRFRVKYGLSTLAVGLRAGESAGRRASARSRGEVYPVKNQGWRLCPLAFWSDDDVWAYIADRELRYNAAYDKMAELGMPRKEWRVSCLLGASAAGLGRYAMLRQIDPSAYNRLASTFPMIARYT